jgi:hypothetical protein
VLLFVDHTYLNHHVSSRSVLYVESVEEEFASLVMLLRNWR